MHRLEKTNKLNQRQDRYDKKIHVKTKKVERIFKHWRKSIYFSGKNEEEDSTWNIL